MLNPSSAAQRTQMIAPSELTRLFKWTRLSHLFKLMTLSGFLIISGLITLSYLDDSYAQEIGLDDGVHLPLYRAQLGFDGNLSSGNFEQRRWNSRGTLFARYGDLLTISNQHRYSYMKNGDFKFSDDFRDLMAVTFRPFERFTPYVIGLYNNSFTRFIDRRWMVGAGGAFTALRSRAHQLKLGLVGSYEWTRLDGRPPPFTSPEGYGGGCLYKGETSGPRSCDREMWRVIPRLVGHHEFSEGHVIVDYEALWVVDPNNLDDERVFMGITVATPLNAWLRLYAHYDFSFESIVLVHRERTDTHLTFGLKINYANDGQEEGGEVNKPTR